MAFWKQTNEILFDVFANKRETTLDAASLVEEPLVLSERPELSLFSKLDNVNVATPILTEHKYEGLTYGTRLIIAFKLPAIDTRESAEQAIIAINANALNMCAIGCQYFVEPGDVCAFLLL